MRSLEQILSGKPVPVSVAPDDTVFEALSRLAKHDIGALLVLEGPRLVGIFSERDYARKVILRGKASKDIPVREVMSDKISCVTLTQSVEDCMALMTNRHVRHLPVLGPQQEVIGIVSIGDLVKETISEQKFIIDQLEQYITT
jgi:CBS domain-containing protein